MKRVTKKLLSSLVLLSFFYNPFAQTRSINVVTAAAPFLRIAPDARAGAMGDLGVATTPDVNAQFYNVAKYAFANNPSGIGMTYTPWLKETGLNDVYLLSLAGYYKLDELQTISGSLRYFSLGDIPLTDDNANSLGQAWPRETGLDIGYSRKLSDQLSLGVSLRYINSNLLGSLVINGATSKPGNAVSGDIGLYYNKEGDDGGGLSYGLALTNLGSRISYSTDNATRSYIPANLALGVYYTKVSNEDIKLSFGFDINKLLVPTPPDMDDTIQREKYFNQSVVSSWFNSFGDAPDGFSEELKEFYFSVGGEFNYKDQFSIRSGYFYENKDKGGRQHFTIGLGINVSNLGVNFSYLIPSGTGVNRNPLSNTMRLGLVFNFGGQESY
jgi:hypothetical protein